MYLWYQEDRDKHAKRQKYFTNSKVGLILYCCLDVVGVSLIFIAENFCTIIQVMPMHS